MIQMYAHDDDHDDPSDNTVGNTDDYNSDYLDANSNADYLIFGLITVAVICSRSIWDIELTPYKA